MYKSLDLKRVFSTFQETVWIAGYESWKSWSRKSRRSKLPGDEMMRSLISIMDAMRDQGEMRDDINFKTAGGKLPEELDSG